MESTKRIFSGNLYAANFSCPYDRKSSNVNAEFISVKATTATPISPMTSSALGIITISEINGSSLKTLSTSKGKIL